MEKGVENRTNFMATEQASEVIKDTNQKRV
jgi:hypothetical protein